MRRHIIIIIVVAVVFVAGMFFGELRMAGCRMETGELPSCNVDENANDCLAEDVFLRRVGACQRVVDAIKAANIRLAFDSVSVCKEDTSKSCLYLTIEADTTCKAQLDARLTVGRHSYEIKDTELRDIAKGKQKYEYKLAHLDALHISKEVNADETVLITNGISALQIGETFQSIDWHSPLLVKMLHGNLTNDDKIAIIQSEISNDYKTTRK